MQFIKSFVDGESLQGMASDSGMDYRKSSVDWASFCREIAMEYVHRDVLGRGADPPMKLNGRIEIDESCFGSRTKYHRGQKRGLKVWVVGLIERSSNRIILYPVDNRDAAALTAIIQRHVEPGSHIYTDGWSAYNQLNYLGFQHFTVVHKHTIKQVYHNTVSGDDITVHTNMIECAWKHAKDYFRRMNGSNMKNFESHIANIMMRNHNPRINRYEAFFDLLKTVYHLQGPPTYTYTHPIYDTWSQVEGEDTMSYRIDRMESDDDTMEVFSSADIQPALLVNSAQATVTIRGAQETNSGPSEVATTNILIANDDTPNFHLWSGEDDSDFQNFDTMTEIHEVPQQVEEPSTSKYTGKGKGVGKRTVEAPGTTGPPVILSKSDSEEGESPFAVLSPIQHKQAKTTKRASVRGSHFNVRCPKEYQPVQHNRRFKHAKVATSSIIRPHPVKDLVWTSSDSDFARLCARLMTHILL